MSENYGGGAHEGAPRDTKMRFSEWLDNFWYHYKWHTVAVLFIILVVVICTVQACQREEYDALVLYAGDHQISRTSQDGDVPEYQTLKSSLKNVIGDYDENGEVNIGLEALFWMSTDQIREFEENKQKGEELPYATISANNETLYNMMMSNDYFVWFISRELYEYYISMEDGDERFLPLSGLVDDGREVEYYVDGDGVVHENAIYLSSTEFSKLPAVDDLPEDTVIVYRQILVGASRRDRENHENAREIVEKIINYE